MPIGRFPWYLCVCKIRIGKAHGGEARCGGMALRHRAVAAVDRAASATPVPLLQAERSVPAECLGPGRCGRQDRNRRQHRESWNAHPNLLADRGRGISAAKQTKPVDPGQFTLTWINTAYGLGAAVLCLLEGNSNAHIGFDDFDDGYRANGRARPGSDI
jgi:hypothetical protein